RRPNMRAQHIKLLESAHMEELVGLAGYMSRLGSSAGQPLQTGRHKDDQDAGDTQDAASRGMLAWRMTSP
ncbi:MAG TPA: hypothetical protein VE819_08280, partial [Steroidobacteraceae bacterium]|nr:hypothetical protein [Steroidobacteraceae bacterium]